MCSHYQTLKDAELLEDPRKLRKGMGRGNERLTTERAQRLILETYPETADTVRIDEYLNK
ncbi:hypothetical protein [Achromobacter xylosoxidans]|uniref:hypothetical protein n=1 Tax=Alcaligenes xylosoxydans xylosoxydans TaxID=85698 RepID=UPI0011DE2C2E|nr:hypothetical protein [Achromobacter xylosoxidans]